MSKVNTTDKSPKPLRLFTRGERQFSRFLLERETFDENGKRHAIGVPALSFYDGSEEYWVHGRLQSTDDKPALCVNETNAGEVRAVAWNDCYEHEDLNLTPFTQVWCDDGFIHRDGAPAVINDGEEEAPFEEWWQHGL